MGKLEDRHCKCDEPHELPGGCRRYRAERLALSRAQEELWAKIHCPMYPPHNGYCSHCGTDLMAEWDWESEYVTGCRTCDKSFVD